MRPRFANLAKLPKARRWTSANYRFQTPGLVEPLFGGYKSSQIGDSGEMLDPNHPAARIRLPSFPRTSANVDTFGGRVYPVALLTRGFNALPPIPFLTWKERVQQAHQAGFFGATIMGRVVLCHGVDEAGKPQPYRKSDQVYPKDDHNTLEVPQRNAVPRQPYLGYVLRRAARRVPMSFSVSTSKKRMGTYATMRAKIVKRMRGVLDLIVSRGAHVVQNEDKQPEIRLNEDDAGRKWSMQGWTYMFYPTTEIYRMPLPDLIILFRKSLHEMNTKAITMENTWLAESLLQYQAQMQKSRQSGMQSSSARESHDTKADNTSNTTDNGRFSITLPKRAHSSAVKTEVPSFSSTGHKSHDAWKIELSCGMALLGKRPPLRQEKDTTGRESLD